MKDESLLSPTVKPEEVSEPLQVHVKAQSKTEVKEGSTSARPPSDTKTGPQKDPSGGATPPASDTETQTQKGPPVVAARTLTDTQPGTGKEPSCSITSSDHTCKMQAEFVDMRIQDTVATGFQILQSDWNHQSEFVNVEEQKNNSIGAQLRYLKIEIVLLQSSLSAFNGEFVQIKANLRNLSEKGTNSQGIVYSTKATMVSLKADTSALKGDTHILKSKVVANTIKTVAVQSEVNNVLETYLNIAHELKTLKTDAVLLHGNQMAIETDMASIKKDFIGVKLELSNSIDTYDYWERSGRSTYCRPGYSCEN